MLSILACVLCIQQDDFPAIRNNERDTDARPMSAEEAAAKMVVPDGFRVSVFASEPEVQNPIAMTWDSKGRMWVAENLNYESRGPAKFCTSAETESYGSSRPTSAQ